MDSGPGRKASRYLVSFGVVGLVAEFGYVQYALASGAWARYTTDHLLSEAALAAFGYGLLFLSAAVIWRKGSFSRGRRDLDPQRRLKSLNATLVATVSAYGVSVALAMYRIAAGTSSPDVEVGSIVHLWVLFAILMGFDLALRPVVMPPPTSSNPAR